MRKLVIALAAVLYAGSAFAAMNLQQRNDGTAEWRGRSGDMGNCVGGHLLHFNLQLSNLATDYQVSPITNAIIRNAWTARPTTTTGTGRVTFWIDNQTTTPVRFVDRTAGTSSTVELVVDAGTWGVAKTISTLTQAGADAIDLGNSTDRIAMGQTVAASSNGDSTIAGDITSKVLLFLCPR